MLLPVVASADDQAALLVYLNGLTTFSATFSQVRIDEDGAEIERAQGDCQIKRPGRFRWHYRSPYQQLIVSDGQVLSIFDPDLEQVTVSDVGAYPPGSPAALLGEQVDVTANYTVAVIGGADGAPGWFALTPLEQDGDFSEIQLRFDDGEVRAMRLTDKLGQVTALEFSAVEHNGELADAAFVFEPPPDVDVVRAPGGP